MHVTYIIHRCLVIIKCVQKKVNCLSAYLSAISFIVLGEKLLRFGDKNVKIVL